MKEAFEGFSFEEFSISPGLCAEETQRSTFIPNKENLILYGPVGTGKSHLAIDAGIAVCNNNFKFRFFHTAALANELIEAKRDGRLGRFLKSIEKCDLVICDEWGYIPVGSEGAKLLFQVISDCYEKKSLILTTNLEFGKWNDIFYDDKLTVAIIDRAIHHSHLPVFDRPSYRLGHSSMRNHEII